MHTRHGRVRWTPFPASPGISRKSFVNWLLGTSLGATLAAALYPVFRFVIPPEVAEAPVNRVLASKLSELALNSGKVFRFGVEAGDRGAHRHRRGAGVLRGRAPT